MLATGKMTKATVRVVLSILMEMSTKAIGSTTKPKAQVPTNIWTGPSTSATGRKIVNMATASRLGQTKQGMRATMSSARNMESAHLNGLTDQAI